MLKNTASQKVLIYAYDSILGANKTGDAANITAYISKDGAAPAQSNDVNPAELDATNMPGVYVFDLTQAETNCNDFTLYAKSSTSGVVIDIVSLQTYVDPTIVTTAMKMLKNKAVQNKTTGVIVYYDDDGTTPILTHTPVDASSTITRNAT